MPTNHVSAEKMGVGKKSGGKHWTNAEVKARHAAAEGVRRKRPVSLRIPKWLDGDARNIWCETLKKTKGLDLLDILDTDMLAIYCDAVAKYRAFSQNVIVMRKHGDEEESIAFEDSVKVTQSWGRLVIAYAEKLGLTPAARARLVKRKADETLDPFGDEFDG